MPKTAKGRKIYANMKRTYKTKAKTDQVYFSMINEGKIKGAEGSKKKRKKKK